MFFEEWVKSGNQVLTLAMISLLIQLFDQGERKAKMRKSMGMETKIEDWGCLSDPKEGVYPILRVDI